MHESTLLQSTVIRSYVTVIHIARNVALPKYIHIIGINHLNYEHTPYNTPKTALTVDTSTSV